MHRKRRLFPVVLMGLLLFPSLGFGLTEPFWIPKDQDTYYHKFNLTWSDFLHLKEDGTYSKTNRQHLGMEEVDRGHWRQEKNGHLVLQSDSHVRISVLGFKNMKMYLNNKKALEDLRILREGLLHFLRKYNREKVSARKFIKTQKKLSPSVGFFLFRKQEKKSFGLSKKEIQAIRDMKTFNLNLVLNPSKRRISLGDIFEWVGEIGVLLQKEDLDHFYFKPLRFKNQIFFQDINPEYSFFSPKVEEIIKIFEKTPEGQIPYSFYFSIDPKTYREETQKNQPFLFTPDE